MRVITNNYKMSFFDRYGGLLRKYTLHTSSYSSSLAIGELLVAELEEVHSFTIYRLLYNSLD